MKADMQERATQPMLSLRDPAWMRWGLTAIAVGFLLIFLVLPLVVLFTQR